MLGVEVGGLGCQGVGELEDHGGRAVMVLEGRDVGDLGLGLGGWWVGGVSRGWGYWVGGVKRIELED